MKNNNEEMSGITTCDVPFENTLANAQSSGLMYYTFPPVELDNKKFALDIVSRVAVARGLYLDGKELVKDAKAIYNWLMEEKK